MALDNHITYQSNVTHYIVTYDTQQILWLLQKFNICVLCGSVALFGIFTNVINLIIYYRQGLNTTSNISFFILAVSDLASLISQEVYVIFDIPLFHKTGLPIVYPDVQFLISAVPREGFVRYSCLITAVITTERCLCIVYPETVNQIITPYRILLVLVCICVCNVIGGMPIYLTYHLGWIFYTTPNRTLFGILVTNSNKVHGQFIFFAHAVFLFLTVTAVVVSTLVLVVNLKQASAWRISATVNQKYALSKRDRTAKSMVVLIACVTIVCFAPSILLSIATFCEPEFTLKGRYAHIYATAWSFALLFETINSSVNIFVFWNMSTNYRRTMNSMFKIGIFT